MTSISRTPDSQSDSSGPMRSPIAPVMLACSKQKQTKKTTKKNQFWFHGDFSMETIKNLVITAPHQPHTQ